MSEKRRDNKGRLLKTGEGVSKAERRSCGYQKTICWEQGALTAYTSQKLRNMSYV